MSTVLQAPDRTLVNTYGIGHLLQSPKAFQAVLLQDASESNPIENLIVRFDAIHPICECTQVNLLRLQISQQISLFLFVAKFVCGNFMIG
jgi:hypothetical protein